LGLKVPVSAVRWRPSYRIIHEHPEDREIFSRVAEREDVEALLALERLTSARAKRESEFSPVLKELDRVTGPGRAFVEAAFAYPNPEGSRFSDGSWGVYYCALRLNTAIRETVFHRARFLERTQEPPCRLNMIVLLANLDGHFRDLRGLVERFPRYFRRSDYSAPRKFGRAVKEEDGDGVVYPSVRDDTGGLCAAVFRPQTLSYARRHQRLIYEWDGREIRPYTMTEFFKGGK
jgi:hypothetical protein